MGGKALLFLVLGFSLIFLIVEKDMLSTSSGTVDNMTGYYASVNAHNIALAGANVGANEVFLDPLWTTGFNDIPFGNGNYTVSVQVLNAFQNIRRITSIGTFSGISDTVQITLQPSKFSKFAYYSADEGSNIWWTTGDTVWGPFHTQSQMKISGDPVFYGKVSTKMKIITQGWSSPQFNGGFQDGVDLPLPANSAVNLQDIASTGGHLFENEDTVYMTFVGDSLQYRYAYSDPPTTVLTSTFAPNGVIFAAGATVRLQGIVGGQFTVGASSETTAIKTGKKKKKTSYVTTGGDVYLDNDIVYKTDPNVDPKSMDLLGIVAENSVFITDNKANRSDINIDASIFAQNGGFGAENYSSRPPSGIINLNGGIIQNERLPVGTFSGGSHSYISSGFSKSYHYDSRLMISSPPSFPNTGSFEIVSWYE